MKWLLLPYSLYLIVVFFLLMPIMVIWYVGIKLFVPYPKQIKAVYTANDFLFFTWSAFVGFRYKIRGMEHVKKDQTYIVICNHSNVADMPAAAYGSIVNAKPLVKKELLKIPLLGWLFAMSSVPVDRKTEEGRKKSMQIMRNELKQGISLLIFVEGTRNRTEKPLKEFHNGAFALSIESGIPILPLVFTNMRSISRPDSYLFKPGTIEVTHLEPIYPDGFTKDQIEDYKALAFKNMWNFLVKKDEIFSNENLI